MLHRLAQGWNQLRCMVDAKRRRLNAPEEIAEKQAEPRINALSGLSDFLLDAVSVGLPAEALARLRRTSQEALSRIGHENHVVFLVSGRKLPGLERLQGAKVKTLHDLHRAEMPLLTAVLCIFDFASTTPEYDDESIAAMSTFAATLRDHPRLFLKVEGHGQPGAPEPLASTLARERADLVADEFQSRFGVAPGRLKITHQSNRCPRFEDPEKNRRVELSIIDAVEAEKEQDCLPSRLSRGGNGRA